MHTNFPEINFEDSLNEEQLCAVKSKDGPALVLAGAGSGKTRTLTYRVAYLLSSGVSPHEILLLTFTNKAAREMLERVEELTSIPKYKLWGGTFHSIAQKILRLHGSLIGLKSNYNILDESEAEDILKASINSIDPHFLKIKDNPKSKVILNIISYSRNTRSDESEEAENRFPLIIDIGSKIKAFKKHYQNSKLKQQVADYDDLLELLLILFKKNPDIALIYQKQFKHVLVDEFQDTNKLQSELINFIAKDHQIMAVGDDAQCIYTWRGANYKNIIDFPEMHPHTNIYKIETNYRSSPEILNFSNNILSSQSEKHYSKKLKSVKPSNSLPYFVPLMDTNIQAQFILKRINGLLQEGYNYSDIAILYRAHYHSMELQMELSRQNIDYVITSGVRFFEQSHIKDLVSQIRFASNYNDLTAFKRFTCLLPKIGSKTSEKIYKIIQTLAEKNNMSFFDCMIHEEVTKKIPSLALEEWKSLCTTIYDVNKSIDRDPPENVVNIATNGWYKNFIKEIHLNWVDREEDLNSLISFASRFETIQELLAQLVLLSSETTEKSNEENKISLKLTTVHQSKGLEFPIVFIIGLADGMFPLKRTIDSGDIEESRRLFYVACTRAKEELYLCYPILNQLGSNYMQFQPSRFIEEIDDKLYQNLKFTQNKNW